MIDKEQLKQDLDLGRFSDAEQEEIFERYTYAVGSALSDGLDAAQMDEFNAIIDGDQVVIDTWLANHAPGYRDDAMYKQFEVGYDEDPEKVPADKVYATVAWVKVNRPGFEQVVAQIKEEFCQALALAT